MLKVGLVTGPADAERAGRAAHERRLARAELAAHEHHVTVPQVGCELAPSDSVSSGPFVSTLRTATVRL